MSQLDLEDRHTLERIKATVQVMKDDLEADVRRFDGAELTGRVVAEIHGTLAAACSALAGMTSSLAEIVERLASAG